MSDSTIDVGAVGRGAVLALVIAVPAAIVQTIATGGVRSLAFLVSLAGFAAGGYVAGALQPRRGLSHGGLAGLAAGLVILVISAVRHSAAGEAVAWASLPLLALLAYSSGAIGGYVAFRRSLNAVEEEQPR